MVLRYLYTGSAFEDGEIDEKMCRLFGSETFANVVELSHLSMIDGLTEHLLGECCKHYRKHMIENKPGIGPTCNGCLVIPRYFIRGYKIALKYEKKRVGKKPDYDFPTNRLNMKELMEWKFSYCASYVMQKGNPIQGSARYALPR